LKSEGRRILVVDDDPEIAAMLGRSLTRHGFQTDTTSSPNEALVLARQAAYDAAVVDLVMPEQNGVHLASALRVVTPGLPVAILTGYTRSPLLEDAEGPGLRVFAKPVAIQDVVDFIEAELA